jgi:hypothetical protein
MSFAPGRMQEDGAKPRCGTVVECEAAENFLLRLRGFRIDRDKAQVRNKLAGPAHVASDGDLAQPRAQPL